MAILMCITCAPYAAAFESFTDPYNGGLVIRDGSVIYYFDAAIRESGIDPLGNLGTTELRPDYDHQTLRKVSAYVAGQAENGVRMPYGGSVYINMDGGASQTISVSIYDPVFSIISINVPLSTIAESVTAYIVDIPPSNYYYYKVKEDRTYRVTPYSIYYRETSFDPWQFMGNGASAELIAFDFYPVQFLPPSV